jgi:hypothetical protein
MSEHDLSILDLFSLKSCKKILCQKQSLESVCQKQPLEKVVPKIRHIYFIYIINI